MSQSTLNSWRPTKFKFVGEIISGGTPESGRPEYWDGPVPWLTPVDLGKAGSDAIASSSRTITAAGVKAAGLSLLPLGTEDLLPANSNQAVSFVRFKKHCMSIFCNEWLAIQPVQEYIQQLAVQSAQPNLSMQDLGDIPIVTMPKLELEQVLTHIGQIKDKFMALSAAYVRQLTLLTEYRAALIHECVTGQRQVPEISP